MSNQAIHDKRNALNAICPYYTMFPLEYPLRVLKSHAKENPIVIDPFCGRGTTIFAARRKKLRSYGIDSSPVAVAIAQAKLCQINVEKVLALAKLFIERYAEKETPSSEFFRTAYHRTVLKEICAIRKGLLDLKLETDDSIILRATMLGCLHGPMSKAVSEQAYFSNQMPRTFASKPAYSINFWKERGLTARKVDTISILRRKLSRLDATSPIDSTSFRNVRLGDSRYLKAYPANLTPHTVMITSPPYYGMRTYVQDQWLRNWFLGGSADPTYGDTIQISHTGHDAFVKSLSKVWDNVSKRAMGDLHMHIRFGTIPSVKSDPRKLIFESFEQSKYSWKIVSVRNASSSEAGNRQAAQMNVTTSAALELDFHISRN